MGNKNSGSRKQRATAQRGTKIPKAAETGPKRISRHERDLKRQKRLKLAVGITAAAVLAILLSFGIYDYIVKPRQVLATVQGSNIRREDYWKYRSYVLYNQAAQYQQYASLVQDPSQQQQYLAMAQQAQSELQNIWGSKSVDDQTLQQMIDDQVYLQSLDELGITVTDEDVKLWTNNQFAPADAPLIPPTVTPTFVPERAEWATQTAEALIVSPTSEPSTPVAGSPQASPIGESAAAQAASPIGSPTSPAAASPIGSPASSPVASPEVSPTEIVSPTPNAEQAQQTAQAGFTNYADTVFDQVHMSRSDYYRLIAKPQVARERVTDVLTADIGQTADQVHAEHILVATEELANQIYQDVTTGGQNFEDVAKAKSTDTSTAPNGGDLGWFSRGVMVAPFEDAAFSTPAGQIHAPVQTQFGWHIIKVLETESNRALTDDQISQLKTSTVNKWLDQRKIDMKVKSAVPPTPTPAQQTFIPPVDAPLPPTPTLEASPVASPVVEPDGTPVASPVSQATPVAIASPVTDTTPAVVASPVTESTPIMAASPAASDQATPAAEVSTPVTMASPVAPSASPMASPIASPIASPASTPIYNPLGTPTGP